MARRAPTQPDITRLVSIDHSGFHLVTGPARRLRAGIRTGGTGVLGRPSRLCAAPLTFIRG